MNPRSTVGMIYKADHYTLQHTKYENSGPCGLGEVFFPIVSLCELMTPGVGTFLTLGAYLAGFIKMATMHCYIQNMKALGLLVSEKKIFLCFFYDVPGAKPVWTPGALLTGFIKRTTINCYTQNMRALDLLVSEKKIFLCFSHCKSMGANDPWGGTIFDPRCMVGRIYKDDHYTLLHTKYESSGPCGFGEEVFFMFFQ